VEAAAAVRRPAGVIGEGQGKGLSAR
jgi:hypothetical protein